MAHMGRASPAGCRCCCTLMAQYPLYSILLDGFEKIINEDVSPRVSQILKLPSLLSGLICAMAGPCRPCFSDCHIPMLLLCCSNKFVDDLCMLKFMGIASKPFRAAETPAKPSNPPDP